MAAMSWPNDPSQPPGYGAPSYGGAPYEPPGYRPSSYPPSGPPGAVKWYRIYAGAMSALYVLLAAIGIFLVVLSGRPEIQSQPETAQFFVLGIVYAIMGVILAGVVVAGAFVPLKPWAWIYAIVLIGLGCTSCACLPATIPLLIAWVKPEVKVAFGRQP
jgi:hypothetical protein